MEERITSRRNPLVQQVKKLLTSKREREKLGLFVSDGTKLLEEAVRYCPGLHTVFLSERVEVRVPESCRVIRVSREVMEAISPMENPQGAVFLCKLPEKREFRPEKGMLLLDGIQDPGNLGTILRTADAWNVPVALLEGCADPFSHKVVRSSMGAVFRTPVMVTDWQTAKESCARAGIPVAVTALNQRAEDIRKADVAAMAVVIGSEGQGVRREILESAGHCLIIPMNDHCESLNAAIAAATVMWQMGKV
ncbi:MAG: RNA methyltransferase [Oscillospiraceae bacterium]|nr:RNA methyltransferase [Oscillospiraceae bacterium]